MCSTCDALGLEKEEQGLTVVENSVRGVVEKMTESTSKELVLALIPGQTDSVVLVINRDQGFVDALLSFVQGQTFITGITSAPIGD